MFSIVLVGACLAWWRRADRRALYLAYGLGLAGIIAVVYLTYLELFVIEAICVWCVSYAVTIVVGWVGTAVAAWTTATDRHPRLTATRHRTYRAVTGTIGLGPCLSHRQHTCRATCEMPERGVPRVRAGRNR